MFLALPTVTVEPHAHQVKIQRPKDWGQYEAMARKIFGVPKNSVDFKLPAMAKSGWNPDASARNDIVLEDVRIRPFQQSKEVRLSATKAVHSLKSEGRRPLNGLEALALVVAVKKGRIKLPVPCEGVHILGAGTGKRVLVLRQNKHGAWQFAEVPSNHTDDHCYASCKE